MLLFLLHEWFPQRSGDDLAVKETVLRWGMASFSLACLTASGMLDQKEVGHDILKHKME
jgi:hypothetical protein